MQPALTFAAQFFYNALKIIERYRDKFIGDAVMAHWGAVETTGSPAQDALPVGFADRTETFNKPFGGEILISGNTWNFVKDYFITEEMPSVTEAGKKERIFAVVNVKDTAETDRILKLLDTMPFNNPALTRLCIGREGPQTLAQLRKLLNIPTPDLSNLNLDEEEKKYSLVPAAAANT